MKYKFISVEGNIGAGKTTLTHLLAEKLKARLILEEFADNPFLPKFYKNPAQYAFPLELFFMAERFQQLKNMGSGADLFQQIIVSDYFFTKCLLFAKINLGEDEYKLYQKLFNIMQPQLRAPDILIYLHAPVSKLQSNIKKRNRAYEQQIPDEYLARIQEVYTEFLYQHPIKTIFIDASNANFSGDSTHVNTILKALEKDYEPGLNYLLLP